MRTVVFVDSQGINRGISLLGKTGYYVPNQRNKVSAFALNSLEVGDFVYVWQCVLGREHTYYCSRARGKVRLLGWYRLGELVGGRTCVGWGEQYWSLSGAL